MPAVRAQRPVLIHRSLVGSMERLFGYLIEVHEGAFPAWYAPLQLRVLPVSATAPARPSAFAAARCRGRAACRHRGRGGLARARIREAAALRVPYVAVIGSREAAAGQVALRVRGGRELPPMPAADALRLIADAVTEGSWALVNAFRIGRVPC